MPSIFEPLGSPLDPHPADELNLGVAVVGVSRVRTLADMVVTQADEMVRKYYQVTNLLALNEIVFPAWLKNSRFWCPYIVTSETRIFLYFQPCPMQPVLFKQHYRAVVDHYRSKQVPFFDRMNINVLRWELVIPVSDTFEVIFHSPQPFDSTFIPDAAVPATAQPSISPVGSDVPQVRAAHC